MPRAKCGKSTERTVDFYLTECRPYLMQGSTALFLCSGEYTPSSKRHRLVRISGTTPTNANTRLSNTLRDRFQRAAERGIAQRVVATLVKPSCLIVDEVGRCVFDRASVFMMRGPSYRGRGLDTYSVEVVPQATNVRGCS